MLAITDCDQICYYVERMVTVEQLMAPDTTTREEELTDLFGKSRAINVRSARSRELHKSRKAFMQGQLEGNN
ncbi:hypothetical protein RvY_02058 [Ramazzottius varieornatus]|uniref:Uncharacterized protein n=1 Tax=Ramazzottius varieornatus TaxID=947166 RepID=A0A1D1UIE9_RAMVA|nr:hypothetical protein RvY_02058 [Ramazzottius varieornatus]